MLVVKMRYGEMRVVGDFRAEIPDLRIGQLCVLRTDRGIETGTVLSPSMELEEGSSPNVVGEVTRLMTAEDYEELRKIQQERQPKEFDFCRRKIAELNLPMSLVSVEHLFGGEKVVFYFTSEGRVDFRDLVKELAREYKTRIEMRQIGVRDEARILALYEHCGVELCCRRFIKELEPVTMKMAKGQKTTLDPAKISGRCGRLMCCLRFEDETYVKLRENLPKKGTRIMTKKGAGEVTDLDVLAQQVTMENSRGERVKVPLADIMQDESPDQPDNPPQQQERPPQQQPGRQGGQQGQQGQQGQRGQQGQQQGQRGPQQQRQQRPPQLPQQQQRQQPPQNQQGGEQQEKKT